MTKEEILKIVEESIDGKTTSVKKTEEKNYRLVEGTLKEVESYTMITIKCTDLQIENF